MNPEQQKLIQILESLVEAELAMSELYDACAKAWPQDEIMWMNIVRDEIKHASYVGKMIELVNEHPEDIEMGRTFYVQAIQTFIKGNKETQQKVINTQLSELQLLTSVLSYEESIIEKQFYTIFKSKNVEFHNLIQDILLDTHLHAKTVREKLIEVRGRL
jgi:hypothetical protein